MNDLRFDWGHININVSDLDRSVAFYKKLGFEEYLPGIPYLDLEDRGAPKSIPTDAARALGLESDTRGRACILQLAPDRGFPKIDLTEISGKDAPKSPVHPLSNADRGIVRICLLSRDVEAAYAALVEQGVEFLSAPMPGHNESVTMATCKDPDGTLVELLELHRERWPRRRSGPGGATPE